MSDQDEFEKLVRAAYQPRGKLRRTRVVPPKKWRAKGATEAINDLWLFYLWAIPKNRMPRA